MTDELKQRQRRKRVTRRSARIAERVARSLISIGGIGTILAVTVICVFLVWVVVPLFLPATMTAPRQVAIEHGADRAKPLALGVDEYRVLGWVAFDDGSLCAFRLDDGSLLERRELIGGARPTAVSFGHDGGVVCGFDDGSIRVGQVGVSTRFLERDAMPEELRDLAAGKLAVHDGAIAQRTPEGQFRLQGLSVEFDPAIPAVHPVRIDLIDHVRTASTRTIAALYADGRLSMFGVRQKTNLLTSETTYELSEGVLPFIASAEHGAPKHLLLNGGASSAFLAWSDGHLERYDTRALDDARLAERVDVVDDPKAELDVFGMLLGRNSLVAGDSKGRVSVWFTTKPHQADSSDGALLSKVHELVGNGAAATAIGPSARTRLLAVGYADGAVRVFHATSATQVVAVNGPPGGESVLAVAIAPKEDGVVALTASGLWSVDLDAGHPEVSVAAIFRPVWYEGYPGPEHVWQSSSGTDDFEPKLGVMPLVFGTLKATLYSMLFGVPLAILAAIYSSEFLNPRLRVPIKSTIEIMASLPSVVLGFLAALVIAPYVQDVVPAVLCAFVTIPMALLAGARAWQLLPQRLALRWADLQRFGFICLALPIGVLAAVACGPLVEKALFAGDLKLWLDGQVGGPIGGWMILFLPLSALAVSLFMGRAIDPWIRRLSPDWNRAKCARVDLVRFAAGAVLVLIVSLTVSAVFGAMGWDARGSYLDTYQQRNALVVGFVMGFAIIPIIYTLAEDALASVPSHLRLASLGCGATPWQTAMRVIVPTAMSGLFSAVMIGLGRAVGETMIVLMATGNTPVMSWNMFSGFRTLSANIAVELPEAVKNSTHYRMLFLAALTLFAITFAVNTAAEIVRQRFRKRAYQL